MNTQPYSAILKRVGIVLTTVGVIDIGVMIYSIANRVTYSSSLNIFAVVAGIFLMRGSLKAASLVRWFAALMFTAVLLSPIVVGFVQPVSLTLTEIRLNPVAVVSMGFGMAVSLIVSGWICKELAREPVQAAIAAADIKKRDFRIAVALGAVLMIAICIFFPWIQETETAKRAKAIAEKQAGPEYSFHVSSLETSSTDKGTSVAAVVTAWNKNEIKEIAVNWKEP